MSGKLEVFNQLQQHQTQFVYLLLAIDISAIGFSIDKIDKLDKIGLDAILVLFAIISWAVSFILGAGFIERKTKIFMLNFKMFVNAEGGNIDVGANKSPMTNEKIESLISNLSTRSIAYYNNCKRFLYLGMMLYIIWSATNILAK